MRVLTENEVRHLAGRMEADGIFTLPSGAILTPLARDYLRNRGLQVVDGASTELRAKPPTSDSRYSSQEARNQKRGGENEALVEAITAEVIDILKSDTPNAHAPEGPRTVAALERVGAHSERTPEAGQAGRAVVWAIGSDHPGILAAVAELLGKRNINILEISQTILSGVFAMVVIVDITQAKGAFGELKTELETLGREMKINLSAQRDEIFQYMHRI